jgi:hypothetical protein
MICLVCFVGIFPTVIVTRGHLTEIGPHHFVFEPGARRFLMPISKRPYATTYFELNDESATPERIADARTFRCDPKMPVSAPDNLWVYQSLGRALLIDPRRAKRLRGDVGGPGRIARLILFTRENAPLCGAFSLYFTISLVAISASLSLNPDLLRAAGVCLHVDLFASVCIDDLERSRRIIQPHRLDLSINREGVSDG